jgi:hypothetical protein
MPLECLVCSHSRWGLELLGDGAENPSEAGILGA